MTIKNQQKYDEFFLDFDEKINFTLFNDFFYNWYLSTIVHSLLNKIGINLDIVINQFSFKFKIKIHNNFIIKYLSFNIIKFFLKILIIYIYYVFFSRLEKKTVFQFLNDTLICYLKMKKFVFEIKKYHYFIVRDINIEYYNYPFDIHKHDISFQFLFFNTNIYFYQSNIYLEKENFISGYYINLHDFEFLRQNKTIGLYEYLEFPYEKIKLLNNLKHTKLFFKIGKTIYIYELECNFKSNKIKLVKTNKESEENYIYIPLKKINITFYKKIPVERVYYMKRNKMTHIK